MNIIIYAKKTGRAEKQLQRIIGGDLHRQEIERYLSIEDFAVRLRQPLPDKFIAILLAADRRDLRDILSLQKLLQDIQIIFILPDRDNQTISDAHRLYPRYLSYIDDEFSETDAVLKNMLRKENFA